MSFHENVLRQQRLKDFGAQIDAIQIHADGIYTMLTDTQLFLTSEFELVIRIERGSLQLVSRKRARRIWELKMEAEKNG